MKKLILICTVVAFCGINVWAGDIVADSVSTLIRTIANTTHPRLIMTAEDFKDYKTRIENKSGGALLNTMNDLIITSADTCLTYWPTPEYVFDASGRRILDQSYNALTRLFFCSYRYRMTGDKLFLYTAIYDLKTVCGFPNWNPSHFLDTAEMALGVSIAYDWLYDELTEEDKAMVEDRLIEYALKPSVEQGFHKATQNWNQICNCGMVAAALAVYEKAPSLCQTVIEKAIEGNTIANTAIYYPDGSYPEGYGYWGYGTGYEVTLLALLEGAYGTCFGLDQTPGFAQTGNYMLFMGGAAGSPFPYADGGTTSEAPQLGMWWFAAKQNDPSLLLNEWRLYNMGEYWAGICNGLMPMIPCLIKDAGFDLIADTKPDAELWYGKGRVPVVMIHTGWNFDEDDTYLGIKGGAAKESHGHMDGGSFVFDAKGVRWSEDMQRVDYALTEEAFKKVDGDFWGMAQNSLRWDVFCMNNLAHSTLSMIQNDGSAGEKVHPSDHIVSGFANIEEVYDTPGNYGAKVDMTPVLADGAAKVVRTFRLEGNTLTVTDEIEAKKDLDAVAQWRMLTKAKAKTGKKGITLQREGHTMHLQVSNDSGLSPEYHIWQAKREDSWEEREWDPNYSQYRLVGYSVTVPAGTKAVLTTTMNVME